MSSAIGVVTLAALIVLVFIIPDPTEAQWQIIRVALALGGGAFAAMLPGTISTNFPAGVGAAGSLAVFAIIFYSVPSSFSDSGEINLESKARIEREAVLSFIKQLPFDDVQTSSEVLTSIENLISENKTISASLEDERNKKITDDATNLSRALEKIEALDIDKASDRELVEKLRGMSFKKIGPWKPSSKALPVRISVPGGFDEGKNYGCPNRLNNLVEFSSNLYLGDEHLFGEPNVTVNIGGLMSNASNCPELYKHDFKMSCVDAVKVFSSKVLKCDRKNNPLWKIKELPRILPAFAIQK